MDNNQQIKEAPEPASRSHQIFQNFTDATVALLDCGATPDKFREMLREAIHEAGNALEAHDMRDCPEEPTAEYTLSRLFNLDGAEEADKAAREPVNA